MMELQIFNGDCALAAWRKSGLPGETLVWREDYRHGPLPETDDPEAFARIRATALHELAPDLPEEEIQAELLAMHRRLLSLRPEDRAVLWIDGCPFDRLLLARLLYLLHSMAEPPTVELIAADVVWNAGEFQRRRSQGVLLNATDLQLGAAVWSAWRAGNPTPDGDFTRLYFLKRRTE